jgi:GR25 family glycosyltransferase involved in LPS biosynthesis
MKLNLFIINEKEKKDRLNSVQKELNKLSNLFDINVVCAVSKKEAEENKFEIIDYEAFCNIETGPHRTDILPTWASVACAMSHNKCWNLIIENNLEYAIVCEDDIMINNCIFLNFQIYKAKKIVENTKIPLIILFNSICQNEYNTSIFNKPIKRTRGKIQGMHFYIINRKAAEILNKEIWPITYQIDIEIGYLSDMAYDFTVYHIPDCGLTTNKLFSSSVQVFQYTKKSISQLFDFLPETTAHIIYSYLPIPNYNYEENYNYNYTNYY